jgi:hypothetical protein
MTVSSQRVSVTFVVNVKLPFVGAENTNPNNFVLPTHLVSMHSDDPRIQMDCPSVVLTEFKVNTENWYSKTGL